MRVVERRLPLRDLLLRVGQLTGQRALRENGVALF
jgi:hypothetical protein